MKNVLLLGLTAILLFSVSAGLSLWLNQSKPGDETAHAKPAKGLIGDGHGDKDQSVPKAIIHPGAKADANEHTEVARELLGEKARVKQREKELEQQAELHQFVIDDVRDEMEALQKQRRLLASESKKAAAGQPSAAPATAAPGPKNISDPASDPPAKNKDPGKSLLESMTPENAAKSIEQLAKAGKLDSAVQILAGMNARQSAKILPLITDEKLSGQILEKLLELKQPIATGKKP